MEDTRQIIPIDEHETADAATVAKQHRDEGFIEFLSQWYIPGDPENPTKPEALHLGSVPACPEGLELLYYFSTKYPTAYEIARARRYIDPPPAVTRTVGWKAYCDHVSGCGDCQESGAESYRYKGKKQ
jgi:hypothetical protein